MNQQQSRPPRLRWWNYIGPWPLRSWVVFWGTGAVMLVVASASQREQVVDHPLRGIVEIALPALVGAVSMALIVLIGARTFPGRTPSNLPVYLLYLLGASAIGSLVHFGASRVAGVAGPDDIIFVPFLAVRLWVWTVFPLAVAGGTVRRLSFQTQLAEAALAASLEQQRVMLINEERSRRQVSALLHDRVQAGLMAVCLELRMAAGRDGGITTEEVEAAIARIDDIRGLDVRAAARALSPDLANVDLRTGLNDLARMYEPGMVTVVEVDPALAAAARGIEGDVLLAAYRVVEQGLLNAVVHGHASKCQATVELSGTTVSVAVVDNGRGGASPGEPGFGSAVIDAWCRVLGGTWNLALSPQGATLTATLPLGGLSQV